MFTFYLMGFIASVFISVVCIVGIIISHDMDSKYKDDKEFKKNRTLSILSTIIFVISSVFFFYKMENLKLKSLTYVSNDSILSIYYSGRGAFDLSRNYKDEVVMPLKYSETLNPENISVTLEKSINRYSNTQYYVSVVSYKPYVISKNSDSRKETWFNETHDKEQREQDYVYFVITYKIITISNNTPVHYYQL